MFAWGLLDSSAKGKCWFDSWFSMLGVPTALSVMIALELRDDITDISENMHEGNPIPNHSCCNFWKLANDLSTYKRLSHKFRNNRLVGSEKSATYPITKHAAKFATDLTSRHIHSEFSWLWCDVLLLIACCSRLKGIVRLRSNSTQVWFNSHYKQTVKKLSHRLHTF